MDDYLTAHGVDGGNIILEDTSHHTWQNICNSSAILEGRGYDLEGVLLVSNGFHLARARMLWRRATGTSASALAAPTSHFPSAVDMLFREPVGLVKSFVLDR